MYFPGFLYISLDFYRFPWVFIDFPDLPGFLWISLDFYGCPWIFMDFRGFYDNHALGFSERHMSKGCRGIGCTVC